MSQQEEASEKQGYCDDDTACTIKVESSDKVTKLFSAFKDFYAMTQKMEVSPFLKIITNIGFNNVFVSSTTTVFQIQLIVFLFMLNLSK